MLCEENPSGVMVVEIFSFFNRRNTEEVGNKTKKNMWHWDTGGWMQKFL